MDYAIAAAVAGLESEACADARSRAIEQRWTAGRSAPEDCHAYRVLWIAATFRRSAGLRPRVPVSVDEVLVTTDDLRGQVQDAQARVAIDAVFRPASEGETSSAAHL